MPLTDPQVKRAKPKDKSYHISDERGLYLEITTRGSKYCCLKYRYGGKEKLLALGVYPEITLKETRARRETARQQLKGGIAPSANKRALKAIQGSNETNNFELVALEWFAKERSHWSTGHEKRVLRALEKDLFPAIGSHPTA